MKKLEISKGISSFLFFFCLALMNNKLLSLVGYLLIETRRFMALPAAGCILLPTQRMDRYTLGDVQTTDLLEGKRTPLVMDGWFYSFPYPHLLLLFIIVFLPWFDTYPDLEKKVFRC